MPYIFIMGLYTDPYNIPLISLKHYKYILCLTINKCKEAWIFYTSKLSLRERIDTFSAKIKDRMRVRMERPAGGPFVAPQPPFEKRELTRENIRAAVGAKQHN